MKCYTLEQPGALVPGIAVNGDKIIVGSKPVDGTPLGVPIDAKATVRDGRLIETPGQGALVLIRDHAGVYGSWHLRAAQPDARWDAMVAANAMPNALDRILAAERVRSRYPHRAPVGWYEFARATEAPPVDPNARLQVSIYGYLEDGGAFELRRRGRLDGTPSVFLVQCRDSQVTVSDPLAMALARTGAKPAVGL